MTHEALVESRTSPSPVLDESRTSPQCPPALDKQRSSFLASMSEGVPATSTPRKSSGLFAMFGKKRSSVSESDTSKKDASAEKRSKQAGKSSAAAAGVAPDLDSTLESDQVLNPPPLAPAEAAVSSGLPSSPGPGGDTQPEIETETSRLPLESGGTGEPAFSQVRAIR